MKCVMQVAEHLQMSFTVLCSVRKALSVVILHSARGPPNVSLGGDGERDLERNEFGKGSQKRDSGLNECYLCSV